MPTTSNFGWTTPADTDLVKDGAAAIRTLGNGIDTSLVDLKGGTTGQILSKNSNTDLDYIWINNDQGDITAVTAGTGLSGGGTTGAVTLTNDMATTITASGDIVVGTGNGTYDNLPIGTTGQVLTADTTVSPYKVKWAAASSGFTLITRSTFSNVASNIMDNIFTTTYDTYLVVIENWTAATTTDVPHMNVRIGGANGTAGYFGGTRILDYSGTLTNRLNFGNTQWDVAPQTPGLSGAFWFNRVGNTSEVAVFHGTLMDRANGYSMFISGFYNATSNVDGLRFKSSSSNVSGEIAVYGLAK